MQIAGFHHVTAITKDLIKNKAFYTEILGLRQMTIREENQKFAYYGDKLGTPGTLIAFAEESDAHPAAYGRNQISLISFVVESDRALQYFCRRFEKYHISYERISEYYRSGIAFQDPDGLNLRLIVAGNNLPLPVHQTFSDSPIPVKYQLLGIGTIRFSIFKKIQTDKLLVNLFGYKRVGAYSESDKLLTVFQSGYASEIHVESRPDLEVEPLGAGSISHIAFRVLNKEALKNWQIYLQKQNIQASEIKKQEEFQSIYFREMHGMLIEIATSSPGFTPDLN